MRFQIILFLLVFVSRADTQNLLPNPGFEEQNICVEYGEACSPMGWRSTVLKNFLYPRYEGRPERVPKAAEGYRFISFYLCNPQNHFDRRFVQAPLLCPLIEGETYRFTASVLLGEITIPKLEIRFVDSLEIQDDTSPQIGLNPDLVLPLNEEGIPFREWVRVEGLYRARGGERGIVIGLFDAKQPEWLSTKKLKRKEWNELLAKRIYIAIDSVALYPIHTNVHQDCPLHENLERIRADSHRHTKTSVGLPMENLELNIIIGGEKIPDIQVEEALKEELQWTDEIRFDFDSYELSQEASQVLFQLLLKLHEDESLLLEIDAHTDRRGDDAYNQRLSEARAQAVAQFFLQRRISENRIRIQAHGNRQVRSSDDAANRRAELRVFRKL